jgi:tRNA (Uracil-5-)-methyltransferase
VVYVSCDPATQMRDLKTFLAAGYTLTAAQPFDLLPQTRHLECVLTVVHALSDSSPSTMEAST